mmetsp:Transcript_16946/g.23871  ORF Transcript_16946/g.23871 Transcript_16946/m.23871 type:complete len:166 (-) Transcript_16946:262-759(-)
MKLLVFFSLLLCQTSAFVVPSRSSGAPICTAAFVVPRNQHDENVFSSMKSNNMNGLMENNTPARNQQLQLENKVLKNSLSAAALVSVLSSSPMVALAQVDPDDYEIAQLPPVWVPALFAVVLLVGVGVLTSSLGDVMSEEASLGMQSGARAKKEMERSRSSYFKK